MEMGVVDTNFSTTAVQKRLGNMDQRISHVVSVLQNFKNLLQRVTSLEREAVCNGVSEPEGGSRGGWSRGKIMLPHLLDYRFFPGRVCSYRFRQLRCQFFGRRKSSTAISLGHW